MLEINNLEKHYFNPETRQNQVVLQVPELNLNATDNLAIYGASGIGKTTLLHLISGLLKADRGSVVIDGKNLSDMSESEKDRFRAQNIGYIFQTFNLLDGYTALENVMLGMVFTGNKSDKDKAIAALTSVGLSDRLHHMPSQLSVGQQQRVSIARALVNNPKVVLADEPTGNLDPANSEEILSLLMEHTKDKVLILVTHEQEVLKHFSNKIDLSTLIPEISKS